MHHHLPPNTHPGPPVPPARHTPSPANDTNVVSLVSELGPALVLVPELELGPVAVVVVSFLAVLARQQQQQPLELKVVEPDVGLAPVIPPSVAPLSSHPPSPLPLPVAAAAAVQ
ncbi:hypothetical protein P691DRAFT_812800 [Macrolepiota fuliginosa MF-IS2]|uniref:Uncharacterized protein n=1 Tax=Macrolepiota fuliginosa MF-IS2 TaxID=1400762 RepID=A0A9P5WZI0_9AGAR|nr:hypothetical protein P691DRAFT_812800 [Macrolepiota fuliginosa MF-IS2]